MTSPTERITSLDVLHPTVRTKVEAVIQALRANNLQFEVFESYRTPQRQAYLYAKGRTTPGPKVTDANAWFSYHQYGLAVDMVLKVDGKWSWDTSGTWDAKWKELHQIAKAEGLEPLSWELPHLQLIGLTGSTLQHGNYPAFGDDAWAENLAGAIADWSGSGAPPLPPVPERPPTELGGPSTFDPPPADPVADQAGDELIRSATPSEGTPMTSNAIFESIQAMIDKWEGGYVDNPSDPGGATNMGITIATLARWRGHAVTKDDVKNLGRAEQRQIMKAYYYNVISGDSLAPPVAAVTYNAAILHGPKRAGLFLQTCVGKYQTGLKIDGVIGPLTIAAAGTVPGDRLVDDYIALELTYMKGLAHWAVFGNGWTNRLNDMRAFAKGLVGGTSVSSLITVEPDRGGSEPLPAGGQTTGVLGVDNMLGTTIGSALVGKKTTIGSIGTLLAVLAPTVGPALGLDMGQVDTIRDTVLPLGLTMLGWGGLGKIDRWIASLKQS